MYTRTGLFTVKNPKELADIQTEFFFRFGVYGVGFYSRVLEDALLSTKARKCRGLCVCAASVSAGFLCRGHSSPPCTINRLVAASAHVPEAFSPLITLIRVFIHHWFVWFKCLLSIFRTSGVHYSKPCQISSGLVAYLSATPLS